MTEVMSAVTPRRAAPRRFGAWLPSWGLIAAKLLELRKRRGLMITVALLIIGPPVLILGIRAIFHAVDPRSYGPPGYPELFSQVDNLMAEFGFIVAAALGSAAGTTDLSDGVFRGLVVTGRSRLSLYLARIPAGLMILLPVVAVAFAVNCLITSYDGIPQPTAVNVSSVMIPENYDQAQLSQWIRLHPQQAEIAFSGPGVSQTASAHTITAEYEQYVSAENSSSDPAINEMVKIGLWVELEVGIGFMVGLGLGSLTGQRTTTTITLIALEIIVTPLLAAAQIPYFINVQRLVVGIAMDQLRPAALAPGTGGGGPVGPGKLLFGGRGALNIPPMPTWAMISVIVGWIIGWSVIGAWRMMTRDA